MSLQAEGAICLKNCCREEGNLLHRKISQTLMPECPGGRWRRLEAVAVATTGTGRLH